MDLVEIPLSLLRMKPSHHLGKSEDFNCESKLNSKIFEKLRNNLKKQPGKCIVFDKTKVRKFSKHLTHSRSGVKFEHLYDTSPRRKIIKLKNARLTRIQEPYLDNFLDNLLRENFKIRKCSVKSIHTSRRNSLINQLV